MYVSKFQERKKEGGHPDIGVAQGRGGRGQTLSVECHRSPSDASFEATTRCKEVIFHLLSLSDPLLPLAEFGQL